MQGYACMWIHTHICARVRVCARVDDCAYVCVCMCACACVVYILVCVRVYMLCVCTCVRCVRVYVNVCTCVHAYVRICVLCTCVRVHDYLRAIRTKAALEGSFPCMDAFMLGNVPGFLRRVVTVQASQQLIAGVVFVFMRDERRHRRCDEAAVPT
jgi:hypothetical protein